MILVVLSIVQLYLLVQDDQNEMQLNFFSHLTLFALASESCHANDIVSSTTVFTGS